MKLYELTTDANKDSQGVWIEYPDNSDGKPAEFLIASTNSKEYRKALNAAVRKRFHRKWADDIDGRDEAEIEAAAKAILLGWRGTVYLTNDKSEATPYNQDTAIAALRIPAFRAWVETEANRLENFQSKDKAADEAALKSGSPVVAEVRKVG